LKDKKKIWMVALLFFAAGLLQILNHDFSNNSEDSLGLIAGGLFVLAGVIYLILFYRNKAKED